MSQNVKLSDSRLDPIDWSNSYDFLYEYIKLPNLFKYFGNPPSPTPGLLVNRFIVAQNDELSLHAMCINFKRQLPVYRNSSKTLKYNLNNRPPFVFKPELSVHYKEAFKDAALKDTNKNNFGYIEVVSVWSTFYICLQTQCSDQKLWVTSWSEMVSDVIQKFENVLCSPEGQRNKKKLFRC